MIDLTTREMEILRLVAQGKRNRRISEDLGIALRTVKHHLEHIYHKAGLTGYNRIMLIRWALITKQISLSELE